MRKLLRRIAKYRMKQAGLVCVNDKNFNPLADSRRHSSYFSTHWREYLGA